jgi:hypothetical protein
MAESDGFADKTERSKELRLHAYGNLPSRTTDWRATTESNLLALDHAWKHYAKVSKEIFRSGTAGIVRVFGIHFRG